MGRSSLASDLCPTITMGKFRGSRESSERLISRPLNGLGIFPTNSPCCFSISQRTTPSWQLELCIRGAGFIRVPSRGDGCEEKLREARMRGIDGEGTAVKIWW